MFIEMQTSQKSIEVELTMSCCATSHQIKKGWLDSTLKFTV